MAANPVVELKPRKMKASMRNLKQFQQYKKIEVDTSDPMKLVVMLYEAAAKNLEESIRQMERKDYSGKGKSIGKSVDIIVELLNALNPVAGEITENLSNLYTYMITELIVANAHMNADKVRQVIGMLNNLLEAWKQVEQQSRIQRTSE